MPIYAYRCTSCGHAKDVLQKMSDPALTECPACGASTFAKQLTAAGFQLKGSGWYATDFKGGGGGKKPDDAGAGKEAGTSDKSSEKSADKPGEGTKAATPDPSAKTTPATSTGSGEPKASASAGVDVRGARRSDRAH